MKLRTIFIVLSLILILVGCDMAGGSDTSAPSDYTLIREEVLLVENASAKAMLAEADIILLDELEIDGKLYLKVGFTSDSKEVDLEALNGIQGRFEEVYYHSFVTPSDEFYTSHQYAPQITGLETVWDNYTGEGIVIAVVDSGVNNLHEDFGGTSAFVQGYNATNDTLISVGDDSDSDGHGTHVAGIIAARQNSMGISGAAPDASIMPVKVLSGGSGSSFDIAEGINWAVDNGADVINLSLGGPGISYITNHAINYALEQGVVVVVAAGNDSHQKINYPAAFQGVITVASSSPSSNISDYSTGGAHISIAAPGEDIYSLSDSDHEAYVTMDGTSMAAPFVAGVAALLLEKDSSLTPAQIKSILESTALDIDEAGFDNWSGFGLIQADDALAATKPTLSLGTIDVSVTNQASSTSGVIVYLKNASGVVLSAGITDADGDVTFPDLPAGEYILDANYYSNILNNNVTLSAGGSETSTFSFNLNLYTIGMGRAYYSTNDVDVAFYLLREADAVGYFYILGTTYPSYTFVYDNAFEYFLVQDVPSGATDSSGYFSMEYTAGSTISFSGNDSSEVREYAESTPVSAVSDCSLSSDSPYYFYYSSTYLGYYIHLNLP